MDGLQPLSPFIPWNSQKSHINLINYNFTSFPNLSKSSSLISTQYKYTQIHLFLFCASTALGYYSHYNTYHQLIDYFVYAIDASTKLCVT